MKRVVLFLTLFVLAGCNKPASVSPAAASSSPTAPSKKVIETGKPEFDAMLAEFQVDPKTKKFDPEIVTFVMTVESVKEIDKQSYLVQGSGPGVTLVCTFLLPPNLTLNQQVRNLAPGDKLTYWAEPTIYKPGTPPTITSLSGSIMVVERAKK